MFPLLIKLAGDPEHEDETILEEACRRARQIQDIKVKENWTEEDEMYLDWLWDRLRRLSFHIPTEEYDTHVRAILP